MKKLILVSTTLLISCLSFAASPAAISAALKTASHSVQDISKITEIGRCRGLDCYILKFEGIGPFGEAYITIQTERDTSGRILLTILEQSR